MDYSNLLVEINHYVMDYLNLHTDKGMTYHNAEHAKYVAKAALKISKGYTLSEEDIFILTVAAWFHDIGYTEGPENHELRGSKMAEKYLSGLKIADSVIDKIAKLILATEIGYQPVNRLEETIRDADLFHLGTATFEKKSKQLHKEDEFLMNKAISNKDWFTGSLEFLKNHQYYTIFCQLRSASKKQQNIQLLQSKLKEIEMMESQSDRSNSSEKAPEAEYVSKGIDTFFQVASSNSQQLSNMADNKANILITVNSIIISAIVSFYLRKLTNDYLYIPAFLILGTSLSSMICSILATRPKVSRGTFNQKDLNLRHVNLLFFGNFYKMKLEKYTEGVLMMINDIEYLQNSLIKDVYYQGVILGRKYFLLRIAYSIFMLGLILAVLAFFIVFILRGHDPKIKSNLHY